MLNNKKFITIKLNHANFLVPEVGTASHPYVIKLNNPKVKYNTGNLTLPAKRGKI